MCGNFLLKVVKAQLTMIFVSITVRETVFKRLEIHYSFLASLTFEKVAGKEISALFIFVT